MMPALRPLRPRCLTALLLGAALHVGAQTPPAPPSGAWRFTHSMAVSGPEPQPRTNTPALRGRSLHFATGRMSGPPPFGERSACGQGAKHETLRQVPVQGLFEGLFQDQPPTQATASAQRLGIPRLPAVVQRVTCANAGFDFVQVDAQTLLTALDGRIWSLSQTPGTQAAAGTPEATVQALLEAHFSSDRGFLQPLLAPKLRWLSTPMRQAIQTYFARPRPRDEVPPIDGDAFTDAQEAPTRFAVEAAQVRGTQARLTVRFADGFGEKRLQYRLVREASGWRVDDILSGDNDPRSLRTVLEKE